MTTIASAFCKRVAESRLDNATVRIGAWFIGAAEKTGGFPLPINATAIRDGFVRDGVAVAGTGSRRETILQSIANLENEGLLLPMRKGTESSEKFSGFDWNTA